MEKVSEYFNALIMGVVLLYALLMAVDVLAQDMPEFYKWGIAIVIAAAASLLAIAKRGIQR